MQGVSSSNERSPLSASLTPELEQCSVSVGDETGLCTPSPLLSTSAVLAISPEPRWDAFVQDFDGLFQGLKPEDEQIEPKSMPAIYHPVPPSEHHAPSSPTWLFPADPESELFDHTHKRRREGTLDIASPHKRRATVATATTSPASTTSAAAPVAYHPPSLLPMEPRPLSGGMQRTEAVRSWLLERRALLDRAYDDVCKDAASLRQRQAHYAHVRDSLRTRIHELRETRAKAAAHVNAPQMLPSDTHEHDDAMWSADSTAAMSSVADLLEKNILCL